MLIAVDNRYIADEGFARRLSLDAVAFGFTRGPMVATMVMIVVMLGLFGALLFDPDWAGAVLFMIIGVFLLALSALLSYRRRLRRFNANTRAGALYESTFGDTTMSLTTPLASSEIAYSAYDRVLFRGEFTYLRPRGLGIYTILPSQLFPPDDREAFRARILGTGAPNAPH